MNLVCVQFSKHFNLARIQLKRYTNRLVTYFLVGGRIRVLLLRNDFFLMTTANFLQHFNMHENSKRT